MRDNNIRISFALAAISCAMGTILPFISGGLLGSPFANILWGSLYGLGGFLAYLVGMSSGIAFVYFVLAMVV